MSEYRRSFNREDPRLNRQNSNTSPKSTKSPSNPNNGQAQPDGWNAQTANYNHTQALQNAYQSIPYHNTGGHQYPTQTYYTGYQNYSYNPYENYQASQQASYINVAEPRPPGDEYPHGSWTSSSNNYTITEPPPQPHQDYNNSNVTSDKKKTDAVAEEKVKQLTSLMKERETYENRVTNLKNKLKLLVEQKDGLYAKRSPDKDTLRIIKENTKLQVEIQSKIKDATNVIEILSNLIGDKKKISKAADSKPELLPTSVDKVNLKHFDPEVHWCRMCDVFPQSAKELLLHLHTKTHQGASQEQSPWHKLPPEPKFPIYDGAPIKRVPIKGLQFFVASTAWYCQLCDSWIGDLHCASQHLMSVTHSQNYTNFVEQNPHWEIEWMKDREKALDRIKRTKIEDTDLSNKHSRRREKYSPSSIMEIGKKKKKRSRRRKRRSSDESSSSSSSSSSSEDEEDKSKSIRVAMRNKLLEGDSKLDLLEKLTRQGKNDDLPDDKLLSQWMTTEGEPATRDKQLLSNLKEKLRQKHDADKAAKAALELEITRRQKERDERERREMEHLEQDSFVKEEDKKHREKMSLKLKSQPSIRDSYKRRSTSRSPDRRRRRTSSSPSRRAARNGRNVYGDRSPRYDRHRRSRSRENNRSRDRPRSRSKSCDQDDDKKDKKPQLNKKLPFIGRMPLFKNIKPKPKDDEAPKREIQKEDYEVPRKTRFQPGNLARAFIPQPEVVCFPQLSSYPPIAPPPPPIMAIPPATPEPPKISTPKPPPPPKLVVVETPKLEPKAERALMEAAREEAAEEEPDEDQDIEVKQPVIQMNEDQSATEDYMLYEDTSNTMYQYGNMEYSMMYPPAPPPSYNFIQVNPTNPNELADPELPKSHTMPLEPPPLPPDDPNEDLAMLGLSSDDLAVQQMF